MIKTESIDIPGFGPAVKKSARDYRVRYSRIDITDPTQIAELEILETKALEGEDIVLLTEDKYTFMDKYFIIVKYLEKITQS